MGKSEKQFSTHKEFFEKVGNDYLHPTYYGENYHSFTIEEMYQHFKARFIDEQINEEVKD